MQRDLRGAGCARPGLAAWVPAEGLGFQTALSKGGEEP